MIVLVCITGAAWSQVDSIQTRRLDEVVIKGQQEINVERLPESLMLPISTRTMRKKR